MRYACFSAVAASIAIAAPASSNLIFDTTVGAGGSGTAGFLHTVSFPNASMGDAFFIDETVFGGGVARAVQFGYVVPASVDVPDCDVLITFYGEHDATTFGSNVALLDPLGTFRFHIGAFAADAADRSFMSGMLDLNAAIDLTGGEKGISIRFVETGTDNLLSGLTITAALSTSTGPFTGTPRSTYFYLDGFLGNPFDGLYYGSERTGFPAANVNNNKLWLQISNVPSPSAGLLLALGALQGCRRRRA